MAPPSDLTANERTIMSVKLCVRFWLDTEFPARTWSLSLAFPTHACFTPVPLVKRSHVHCTTLPDTPWQISTRLQRQASKQSMWRTTWQPVKVTFQFYIIDSYPLILKIAFTGISFNLKCNKYPLTVELLYGRTVSLEQLAVLSHFIAGFWGEVENLGYKKFFLVFRFFIF